MCEWTVPVSQVGDVRHRRRGEKVCDPCREAMNAWYRAKVAAGQMKGQKWTRLWMRYRIRRHEWEAIYSRQGGMCAICGRLFKSNQDTHTDHDYRCDHPGKGKASCGNCVRGLLCTRCNTALFILDDIELLKKALDYLGREDVAEIVRQSRLW